MPANLFIATGKRFAIETSDKLPGTNDYGEFAEVYNYMYGNTFAACIGPVLVERVIRYLGRREELAILDIGCGGGAVMSHIGRVLGCQFVGVDLSSEQVRVARQTISPHGIDARFVIGDALYVDLPDNCDVVIMTFDVVNHIGSARRIATLLKRVSAVLKPGGVCLFDVITRKRVEEDTKAPIVLVKPGVVAVQCGLSARLLKTGVKRRIFIQVVDYRQQCARAHRLIIEHYVMEIEDVKEMLMRNGMEVLDVMKCNDLATDGDPYMENRLLIAARRKL